MPAYIFNWTEQQLVKGITTGITAGIGIGIEKVIATIQQGLFTTIYGKGERGKLLEFVEHNLVLMNLHIPLVLTLPVNPKDLKVSSTKVIHETLTAGGYVYEHWGETPELLSFTGVTLGRYGDRIIKAEYVFNLLRMFYKLDKVWQANLGKSIENWILDLPTKTQPELTQTWLFLRGVLHKGFFKNFTWDYVGENEYYFTYHFDFQSTWSTSNWLETSPTKLPELLHAVKR